jgi:penicillin amidase
VRSTKQLLCVFAVICLTASAQTNHPSETLHLPGLKQPVQILKDRWGISHIYANNESDLFFAQGYNVARDGLFQLELWRRQATGSVAEILGRKELRRDIGNRLFAFRGDLNQELNWYHPHGAAIVQSFVDGINAYIAQTRRDPALLTPEFKMLGIKPGNWTPAVVITRFNGLAGNVEAELDIAREMQAIGVERTRELDYFQPDTPDLHLDSSIQAGLLSAEILGLYTAFRSPLHFTPDELAADGRGHAVNQQTLAQLDEEVEDWSRRRENIGSNNWVVAGKLTASGYPLLANDPHRAQAAPSLRYWVHLVAPGWNVLGGGEPSLPGVSIGHNEYGAWGLTIFGTDTEDLYVYDTNPEDSSQYRYRGAWVPMKVIKESIPVKGEAPVIVELKYTRHGPVIYEDKQHHKAYAVRAAWLETGAAPYLASLRMDQAKTWEQFQDACTYSRMPAENMVWADRAGNIGYQAVGIAPRRPNWSGLLPVPGDGRYEWSGFLPIKDLPHLVNPDKGFFNTSNNYLIPPGWPYKDALHYTWADPYRADSVEQFLRSGRMFTVSDMMQLQNNVLSIPARELMPLLRETTSPNAGSEQARQRLLHWNFLLEKDSTAAGIYEIWQHHVQQNLREQFIPAGAPVPINIPPLSRTIQLLETPAGQFGPDPIAGRDALLLKSLDETVGDLTKRFGADMDKWKLGAYHHALIYHPMTGALNAEQRAQFDVGDLPRGGDAYTIDATGGAENQFSGGSFKIIIDTEDWDHSLGLNNPGQSGDVRDSHYRDLYPLWARGRYFPIFYSREKIESVTEKTFDMEPSSIGAAVDRPK